MLGTIIQDDSVDLETLWRGHRAIAMEGFSESFASLGVVKSLRANFDRSQSLIKNYFKNRDISVYPKVDNVHEKLFNAVDFTDVIQLRAYVPAGMSVKMNAYTTLLCGCIDSNFPRIIADIDKLTTVCAKAINNAEYRRSVGFAKEIPANNPDGELEALRKLFKRGGITQSSIGKVYGNKEDVIEVYRTLTESRQLAVNTNPKDVRKAIDAFVEVCGALTQKLEDDYQEGSISNAMIRDISEAIFLVARQAEFYGFLVNGLGEVIKAWNDTWVAANKAV